MLDFIAFSFCCVFFSAITQLNWQLHIRLVALGFVANVSLYFWILYFFHEKKKQKNIFFLSWIFIEFAGIYDCNEEQTKRIYFVCLLVCTHCVPRNIHEFSTHCTAECCYCWITNGLFFFFLLFCFRVSQIVMINELKKNKMINNNNNCCCGSVELQHVIQFKQKYAVAYFITTTDLHIIYDGMACLCVRVCMCARACDKIVAGFTQCFFFFPV